MCRVTMEVYKTVIAELTNSGLLIYLATVLIQSTYLC